MKPFHETCIVTVLLLAACPLRAGAQAPLGTAFTYQGKLNQGGAAVTGGFDLLFTLWTADAGGAQPQIANDNAVSGNAKGQITRG